MSSAHVRVQSPGRQVLDVLVSGSLDVGREGDGLLLADERISRSHCRLEAVGAGAVQIVDLGSANGVLVNGKRIDETVVLQPGTSALIGDTRIEIVATDQQPVRPRTTVITSLQSARPSAISRVADEVTNPSSPGLVELAEEPGTLTIVFSDIEESTEHALRVGDEQWMKIMDHHTALMTRHVNERQGRIVRNLGDGFMMSFRSARQGALAAIDMQRHLSLVAERSTLYGVKVRIGLHTGEVLQNNEGDLFGRHVQLAAKIGDAAQGGQILVSNLVKAITAPRGDFRFGEEMQMEIEGVDTAQPVFELEWREIAVDAGGASY